MAVLTTPGKWNTKRFGKSSGTGLSLIIAGLVCASLLMPGCGKKKDDKEAEKANNVKVWVTERRPVRPYIDTIGNLVPNNEVIVSSEADGVLRSVRVEEGTPVWPGTVLAEVDGTDYRLGVANASATLKQAEANFDNLKLEHKRKEVLLKDELVTKQQYDDISTRLKLASHEIERARVALSLSRQRLEKTTVVSPTHGVVKEKRVSAGDFVRMSMPLFSIVQVDPLKLSFTIAEKDVGLLGLGQDVTFTVDPYPGESFHGKLSIINPSLDERTRTLRAEANVPNPGFKLKPGFFAHVKVFTSEAKEAVVIPVTSLLYEGTRVKVFLRQGDRAREREIKVGDKFGEMVEVRAGLIGGEQLIVVGQNTLADGVKLNVVK